MPTGKREKTGSTRETKNFRRTRKMQPTSCKPDSYKTKKTRFGFIVFCRSKYSNRLKVQSIAKKK